MNKWEIQENKNETNNNIVPFNYVFDKFTIKIMGDYPVGPNVALPIWLLLQN